MSLIALNKSRQWNLGVDGLSDFSNMYCTLFCRIRFIYFVLWIYLIDNRNETVRLDQNGYWPSNCLINEISTTSTSVAKVEKIL